MDKIRNLLLIMVMAAVLTIPSVASAESEKMPLFVDDADLVSSKQEQEIAEELRRISKEQKMDVVIITMDSCKGEAAEDLADDLFDYGGYGQGEEMDGILLLVTEEDRQWHISTTGYGITAFTDAGLEFLSKKFLPYMKDDEYEQAFREYASWCDLFIAEARAGHPFDTGHMPKEKLAKKWMLYDLLIGIALVFAFALFRASRMKSIVMQRSAGDYERPGSMVLTRSNDNFVNRTTTSRTIETSSGSSVHEGSSGREHGGTGGSF